MPANAVNGADRTRDIGRELHDLMEKTNKLELSGGENAAYANGLRDGAMKAIEVILWELRRVLGSDTVEHLKQVYDAADEQHPYFCDE